MKVFILLCLSMSYMVGKKERESFKSEENLNDPSIYLVV